MKKLSLLLFITLFSCSAFSQSDTLIDDDADEPDTTEIESLPWFGNNQYLEDFLDSIGYPSPNSRIIGLDRVRYRVPIKFWIYRRTDGTGGPDMRDLRNYIDNLNRVYNVDNNTLIGFYMKCDVTEINDDDNFEIGTFLGVDVEAWNLIQNRKEKGCINIHIVGDYERTAGIHIRARVFGRDGIVLNFGLTGTNTNTTIAHEVGHYFELYHTHEFSDRGSCRKEAIDRNRTWPWTTFCPFGGGGTISQRVCESTGDLLSDTPADPDLSNNNFTAVGACTFNATGNYTSARDPWNDAYVSPPAGSLPPDPTNVMSYNRDRDCRNQFSRLQIAVMLHSIIRGKSVSNAYGWNATRTVYDEYEMDNFAEVARPILVNEIQERNFHQQYNEDASGNHIWTNCDVDWVRYTALCNATFDIETSYFQGTISPDTRITLFADDGTQLAQNDNISGTNSFSRINFAFTAGTTYLIRVENLNPVINYYNNSYYKLSIGGTTITGADEFCVSSTYTLNIPPGATNITWTVNAQPDLVWWTTNGNQITLFKDMGNGNATITATYTHPCLGNGQVSKTVFVGLHTPSFGLTAADYCQGTLFEAIAIPNNAGTVTYNWYVNGVLDSYHGYKLRRTFPSNSTTIGVQVIKSGCGVSNLYSEEFNCTSGFRMSPNPSNTDMTIESTTQADIKRVRILDKFGQKKIDKVYSGNLKKVTINVSHLSSDLYLVQVHDGSGWSAKQAIIQH